MHSGLDFVSKVDVLFSSEIPISIESPQNFMRSITHFDGIFHLNFEQKSGPREPGLDSPQRGVVYKASTQGGHDRFLKTISQKKFHRTLPQPNIWGLSVCKTDLRPWTPGNLLHTHQTPNIGLPPPYEIDMVLRKWA